MEERSTYGDTIYLLSQKVNSIETRFESHSSKVETRLDQLVDIMKQVAILQEREMKNADTIREIKEGIRRSHERIDSLLGQIEDYNSDIKTQYIDYIEKETAKNEIKIKNLEMSINNTDETLKSWLNRGKGAWYVMLFTFTIIQAGAGYMMSQLIGRLERVETSQQTLMIEHVKDNLTK